MSDETNDISKALAIVPPIEVEVVEDYADAAWESSTESAASPDDGHDGHDGYDGSAGTTPKRPGRSSAPVLPTGQKLLMEMMMLMEGLEVRLGEYFGKRIVQVKINDRAGTRWVASESRDLSDFIRAKTYDCIGYGPGMDRVKAVVEHIEAKALNLPSMPMATRHLMVDGVLYVGRGPGSGEAIAIDGSGYRLVADPPVIFVNGPYAGTLPVPEPGGDAELLRGYFPNLEHQDWVSMLGFMVACFTPAGGFPVLLVHGPANTGKSTLTDVLKRILDPVVGYGARTALPTKPEDLMNIACQRHLVSFDNISYVSGEMSDALCGLATGSSIETRTLYAQGSTTAVMARCPIILNGITIGNLRPDLASRCVRIETRPIPEDADSDDGSLFARLERDLPKILGFLFSAVSMAIRDQRETKVTPAHRLRDAATMATAAEPELGLKDGEILTAWLQGQANIREDVAGVDPVVEMFTQMLNRIGPGGQITGSASTIFQKVISHENIFTTKRPPGFPDTAQKLAQHFSRYSDVLHAAGLKVYLSRTSKERTWTISLKPTSATATETVKVTRPNRQAIVLAAEIDAAADAVKGAHTPAA